MNRYANKGDYMPVEDCPTLNMVSMVIDFYKREPKRLKTIFLDHAHWRLFVEDLKRVDDSYVAHASGVQIEHSDVTVKRGSQFQNKEMFYEFYKDVEIGMIVNPKMATC